MPDCRDDILGLAVWSGNPRRMPAAHRHLDLEINYVLRGTMTYLIGGAMVTLPHRRLCVIWGGVPHQLIDDPTSAEVIWMTTPLTHVLGWHLPDPLIRHLLGRGLVVDDQSRPSDADLLCQWMRDLRDESAAARQIVLLEMEARLRRLALCFSGSLADPDPATLPPEHVPSDSGAATVEAMARFIAANYRETIRVDDVAGKVHLHPNYAMTLFRRHTSMTLSRYLLLQRVAHAQRLLATTDCSIVEAALDSGFGSVSRFYEAFKQQTGCSPRQFRLRLAAGPRQRER